MRRKAEFPLEKTTLNLFAGDMARLKALYPRLGASNAIRLLIRNFLKEIEGGASRQDVSVSLDDIEIPIAGGAPSEQH